MGTGPGVNPFDIGQGSRMRSFDLYLPPSGEEVAFLKAKVDALEQRVEHLEKIIDNYVYGTAKAARKSRKKRTE